MNDEQNIVVENELLRRGLTSIPNYIFGMPIISNAKLIYMALLSYAWNNRSCYPGLAKLCSDVSLSDKPVTKAIEELTQAALLEVRRRGQGKTNIYIIKDFNSTIPAPDSSESRIGESPALKSENLRNPIEEKYTEEKDADNTSTQKERARRARGVGVGSKFSLEECQKYAAHLHATGQGITNPGGYATTIYRTGEADTLIERFFNPPALPSPINASRCPDCKGFKTRPDVGESSHALIQRAKAEARKKVWLDRVQGRYEGPTPQAYVGAIAAGEKLVASTNSQLYDFLIARRAVALRTKFR